MNEYLGYLLYIAIIYKDSYVILVLYLWECVFRQIPASEKASSKGKCMRSLVRHRQIPFQWDCTILDSHQQFVSTCFPYLTNRVSH